MGGKVASLSRVFSAVELVICNEAKIFHCLRTTYSCLDKLSPDDATLPPISCRTPRPDPMKKLALHSYATLKIKQFEGFPNVT